nr:hypothetical protein [Tanacetum cinerariifolium]
MINDEPSSSNDTPIDESSKVEKSNDLIQKHDSKKTRILEPNTHIPSAHFCKPVKQICNGTLRFWPTCNLTMKACTGGVKIYGMNEKELAEEYGLGIGNKGHMLDDIWENCKKVQGDNTYWCHEMVNILVLGEEYDKVFKHLDMLNASFEGKVFTYAKQVKPYMMDYTLWEVIENGTTLPKTQVVDGVMTTMPITTAEEKAQRRLELKERNTLMMGILKQNQLKFNSIKDAQQLLEAVEKRSDLDTMSMDDLYNNLKVYEPKVKGMSSSYSNTQNIAFLSSTNSNTNGVVKTTQAVNTANTQSLACTRGLGTNSSRWHRRDGFEMANGYVNYEGKKILKEYWKKANYQWECRAPRNQDTYHKESRKRNVPVETPTSTTLVSCDGFGGYYWSDQAKEGPNYALMAFTSSSSDPKKGLGYESYNAVPPPYTGNFMPLKLDLSYTGLDEFVDKLIVENTTSCEEETKAVRKNSDAPIIEEWVSDDDEEIVTQPKIVKKTVRPNIVKKEFVKTRQQEKPAKKTVKKVEHNRQNTNRPRGNQINWNKKMS